MPQSGVSCGRVSHWPTCMGYKSDLKTFDVDNVKLTLAYGVFASQEIDEIYIEGTRVGVGLDIPEFEVYIVEKSGNTVHTVREVKESFVNEKYRVFYEYGANKARYYKFNHSEEITIPKELFTESEGIIKICIGGINVAGNEPEYTVLCSEEIKYQLIENDKVVLSPRFEY